MINGAPGNILIFGGAGFIGCNWASYLLASGDASIHIFDNLSRPGVIHNLRWLQQQAGAERLHITVADIRDTNQVSRAVAEASEIYHFAAQVAVTTSVAAPRRDFEINLLGSFNILEAIRMAGHRPFLLFTSSNKVYGNLPGVKIAKCGMRYGFEELAGISEEQPLAFHSPYGCSKGAADQYTQDYARIYGIPAVVLRMSCIAGPRQFGNEDQGWLAHFAYSALEGKPLTIYGDGCQVRDVLHVHDLVRAFEAARQNREAIAGNVYNIGGGVNNAVSLLEVIGEIQKITAAEIEIAHAPARAGDQSVYVTDFQKFARATGWRPRISLVQILADILSWRLEHRELFAPLNVFPEAQPVAA